MSFPNPFTNGASPYLLALEHDIPVQPWELEMFENADSASNPPRGFQHQSPLPRPSPPGQGRRNPYAPQAPPRGHATARNFTAQNSHHHNVPSSFDFSGPRTLHGRAGPVTVYYRPEETITIHRDRKGRRITTRQSHAPRGPPRYQEAVGNERQTRIGTTPLNVSRATPQPRWNEWRRAPVQPYVPVEGDVGILETEAISNPEIEAANQQPLRTQAPTPSDTAAEEEQDNCPFCQDTITDNVSLVPCGHTCCRSCLRDFATHLVRAYSSFQRPERYKCPVCRASIVDRENLLR
ncbi:hypothetical protein BP6252_02660 [Coleophoma cylindrospora]|uniref:RING-type domain-containing protein n=1 Tax=Coleophoma cylindrospora TaxID=1849047 RepID=A0A3D8SFD7_9HELO|nr:hypothetical protein BP6252_02660 [Coleophoma cylindrospora]